MAFADDALKVLAGGLPALADYGSNVPYNAFPEQVPPTGVAAGYEPGLFNTSSGGLSTGGAIAIGVGVVALLAVVVLATR